MVTRYRRVPVARLVAVRGGVVQEDGFAQDAVEAGASGESEGTPAESPASPMGIISCRSYARGRIFAHSSGDRKSRTVKR